MRAEIAIIRYLYRIEVVVCKKVGCFRIMYCKNM